MSISMIDKYINRKLKNTLQYTNILMNKVYPKDEENQTVFESCIHRYINEFIINNRSITEEEIANKDFFAINQIKNEEQKKIIIILLDIITKLEQPLKDVNFINNVNLFSEVIAMALEIEEKTAPLINKGIGYHEIMELIKNKYEPITNKILDHNLRYSNEDLKEKIHNNAKDNKEFREIQSTNLFYLEFHKLKVRPNPPNLIYEIKMLTKSKELEKFNANKIEQIMSQKNILYEHTFINLEMLSMKLLEILIERKALDTFYIKLPDEFLANKNNKAKMLALTGIKEIREKIGFEINYGQFEKYHDVILEIKDSNYKIVANNLETKEQLTDDLKQIVNGIIIDSNTCQIKTEVEQYCQTNQILLVERDVGEEVILNL